MDHKFRKPSEPWELAEGYVWVCTHLYVAALLMCVCVFVYTFCVCVCCMYVCMCVCVCHFVYVLSVCIDMSVHFNLCQNVYMDL